MPKRGIWTGTLSFVLVSIPVELVSAVNPGRISFNLLHEKDYSRLERRMYCPEHDQFVHPEHIFNGYEVEKGKYVVVTEDEYESLAPERSQSIEINSFIDMAEVDPVLYDRPYYLVPKKGGEKAYSLLLKTLRETEKAGVAKFVLRNREHLVTVWAEKNLLCLMMMHFPEEIRDPGEVKPEANKKTKEVNSMVSVIEKNQGSYNPEKYSDTYREQAAAFLEEKIKSRGTVTSEEAEEEGEEIEQEAEASSDLVAALERSLEESKSRST
jgi:DNA end-binding protein Ku